jgi:subtilisin
VRSWLTQPWYAPVGEEHDWGDRLVGVDQLPPTLDGSGITLAILDTGVDLHHPDLRVANGIDIVANRGFTQLGDENGHGTFVSGVAAAQRNSLGVLGMCPGVRLIVAKVGDADPATGQYRNDIVSDLLKGLQWAVANGADVINMSLELRDLLPQSRAALDSTLSAIAAKGILLVAAAGNGGGPVSYPASHQWVLAVGAVGSSTVQPVQDMRFPDAETGCYIPFFSNNGPGLDVVAPGIHVPSTMPGSLGLYALGIGTSFAAPYVSATCALIVQWIGPARSHSLDFTKRVADLIRASARPMQGIIPTYQGSGILNASGALAQLGLSS